MGSAAAQPLWAIRRRGDVTDDSGGERARPGSAAWRSAEVVRLIDFARAARDPRGGFGWLSDVGTIASDGPRPLWITARMTHCFALGKLVGIDGCAELAHHGLVALDTVFRDAGRGGWIEDPDEPNGDKTAYGHAFVALAAASLSVAGLPAAQLFADVRAVITERFWTGDDGLMQESLSADWTTPQPYRGANSTMHMVEASLAVADALDAVGGAAAGGGAPGGERPFALGPDSAADWRRRAVAMTERVVHKFAAENSWRIPEHFDAHWQPLLDYNRDEPAHPFRPFGATVGHGLEWARLCLHQHAAEPEQRWLLDDAIALADRATADGWAVDGAHGFVYTTDWNGGPVVRDRMHWVLTEAVGTASALLRATQGESYAASAQEWWSYAETYLLDRTAGSWHHQLDPANRPIDSVWVGKPDIYHAVQACLLPDVPLDRSIAVGLLGRNVTAG